MNVELLYLYIGENNTPVKNIDICFSHEYQIKYENKKLTIEKNKEYQHKDFYGKYIKHCSLIVGKNGSGKTTLLNFLGLFSKNLNKYYNLKEKKTRTFTAPKAKFDCNDLGCWFALYTVNDEFYIEGYNYDRLFGQKYLDDWPIDLNFSLFFNYDFNTKTLKLNRFSNNYTIPDIDCFYYKRLPESNSSEFESQIADQMINTVYNNKNERVETLRLFRKEILNANINNIYRLSGDYYELLFEKDFAKKAKIIIEIKEIDYDSSELFDKIINEKFNYVNNENLESPKNKFIANLYYMLAFGLWNAYIKVEKSLKDNFPVLISNKSIVREREIALYYQNLIQSKFKIDLHNYVEEQDKFTECLKDIDEKYFLNSVQIEIPLIQHDEAIQKTLDCFYSNPEENGLDETIKIKYTNLSSGEHEYIEVFGSLIKILSKIDSDGDCKDRVLIFDEPDRTFHPEWTSNYISKLFNILNSFGEKKGISFQVIISIHSPFMVSDILKEDIYKIETINGTRRIVNSGYGFASNYYDIMKDTFFLTSSVGHFAKEKIEDLNKQIEKAKTINELVENKKIIDAIGDEYLKKILINKYNKKLADLNYDTNISSIKKQIDEKEQELRILRELLEKNE